MVQISKNYELWSSSNLPSKVEEFKLATSWMYFFLSIFKVFVKCFRVPNLMIVSKTHNLLPTASFLYKRKAKKRKNWSGNEGGKHIDPELGWPIVFF